MVAASRDKSAAVRVAVAEALPGVARADSGSAALAREIATSLVGDVEIDVRVAISLQAAAIADGVGGVFVASVLLPTLDELVRDESVGARVELAGVLMSLASRLGAERASTHVLPLVQLLVDDTNTNVRPPMSPPCTAPHPQLESTGASPRPLAAWARSRACGSGSLP